MLIPPMANEEKPIDPLRALLDEQIRMAEEALRVAKQRLDALKAMRVAADSVPAMPQLSRVLSPTQAPLEAIEGLPIAKAVIRYLRNKRDRGETPTASSQELESVLSTAGAIVSDGRKLSEIKQQHRAVLIAINNKKYRNILKVSGDTVTLTEKSPK